MNLHFWSVLIEQKFCCLWQCTSKRDELHCGEGIYNRLTQFRPWRCKQAQHGGFGDQQAPPRGPSCCYMAPHGFIRTPMVTK